MRGSLEEDNEVRETRGWERIRVQIDSGAMGPKEPAKAFEMKDTIMSKRGIGFVAASGSGIKNYREKKIIGHTEDGRGVSLRIQHADAKKVVGSVHKMNVGGNAVVLDGEGSYTQNKEMSEKTTINNEQGQYVMCGWVPVKEGEVAKEMEKVQKGNRFSILATESQDQQVFTRRA